eukprot:2478170-Heterocapsa_arctica.AAC.1
MHRPLPCLDTNPAPMGTILREETVSPVTRSKDGRRGDLSQSQSDAQQNALHFSQIMNQNGPTDQSKNKT